MQCFSSVAGHVTVHHPDASYCCPQSQAPRPRQTVLEYYLSLDFPTVLSKFSLWKSCRCVDYAVKIRVNPSHTGVDTNVKHSMVRYCLQIEFLIL